MYVNYHKHDHISNIMLADSVATMEDYAKRAVELNQTVLSSCNHGTQGNYWECAELAEKYGLKWRYVTEAYFVKDRFEKDKSNCHLILAAKTRKGVGDLNYALSEANITGYYYRPRVDLELLMALDPKDVFVTTACVGGVWKYGAEEAERLIALLNDHFRGSFMLEVQAHNVDKQKDVNRLVLDLYRKYNIPLIAATDSHFIYPEDSKLRDQLLESHHLKYEDEEGWDMDYPSEKHLLDRFKAQGVLSVAQINEAMENTNVFLDFEDVSFGKRRKLPAAYPDMTQEERNQKYLDLVHQAWDQYKAEVPQERWPEYEEAIRYETDAVTGTNTSDYFLIDNRVVDTAKREGGVLTQSGRGCFTDTARVPTLTGLKQISQVAPGDVVIDKDGDYQKVIETFSYDIDEPLVEIQAPANKMFGSYPTCTLDHRVLVCRLNGSYDWVEASRLKKGDLLCVPKIVQPASQTAEVVDLSKYISRASMFDGDHIFELRKDMMREAFGWEILMKKFHISRSALYNFVVGRTSAEVRRGPGVYLNKAKREILDYYGVDTQEALTQKYKDTCFRLMSRWVVKDALYYEFLGMMYGDGWVRHRNDGSYVCGIAINAENEKNIYNRKIFETMASRVGGTIYEAKAKNKKLVQLTLHASSFAKYLGCTYFISKKGNDKVVPDEILLLDNEKSKAFLSGLMRTDGCFAESDRKCFDNTSPSLMNAFNILCMKAGEKPPRLTVRDRWFDKRGYNCKTSYKWVIPVYSTPYGMSRKISENDKYWLIPVTGINLLPRQKCKVYDLHIENSHSYLLNHMVVHNSGVSFLTNMLLGFSSVDRLKMPVTMYPDRFISKERLSTGQMPDLDLNCGNVEVFEKAQAEVMGEWHSAQMVAFGTLKRLSAWKMYCRSTNVAFETANAISDSLKKYELDVKYAEDDEDREAIDPFDYVPKEYHEQLRMSNKYLGMVDSISPSPCSYLLTDQDIRREIGLYRINSKTGKKGTIYAAFIDGATADRYGYLKNDLLSVTVVNINAAAYKAANIPLPSVNELLAMCPPDDPVWDMYAKGYTMGLNQVEREKATEKVARYKPRNITELAAFVAAIRPGFKSMIDTFLARRHFDYGIPSLDNLLQTKEIPDSFLMFQEQIMKVLQHGGFTGAESYAAIKAISKKHPEKVLALKEKFRATFSQRIVEEEHVTEAEALATTDKIWQIINDSCSYLFNASHATCVALDSLYGAWLKAHYPYQYYTTLLRAYAAKKDKDRIAKAKEEMRRAFGIRVVACKFGQDNRDFFIDESAHTIADALTSVKHVSRKVADALYKMRDTLYLYFTDLLYDMDMSPAFDATSITALIKMGYFSDFGGSAKLLKLFQEFKSGENRFYKGLVEKTQQKRLAVLRDLESSLPDEDLPMEEIIPFECDYFGAPLSVYPEKKGCYAVIDVDEKYSPKLKLYSVSTGDTGVMKIRKPDFAKDPVKAGDVIKLLGWQKKPAYQYQDGKRSVKPGVTELWMDGYKKISVSPAQTEKAG